MMSPGVHSLLTPLVSIITLLPLFETSNLPATSVALGKFRVTFSASTSATRTRLRPATSASARTQRKLSPLASL